MVVEHYRPKGGYTNSLLKGAKLHKPGYYWLAYNWDNLLFSCSKCNISYKRNYFAISQEANRSISLRDVSHETPLVINPYIEDPGVHMRFKSFIAVPLMRDGHEDEIGRATIAVFQLNDRKDLVERRRKKWILYSDELLKRQIFQRMGATEGVALCDAALALYSDSSEEFCGMFNNQME